MPEADRSARQLKLLEGIKEWKMQEQSHAELIRLVSPGLEPAYRGLLQQWEPLFRLTGQQAEELLGEEARMSGDEQRSEEAEHSLAMIDRRTAGLLEASALQTRTFTEQLAQMLQASLALARDQAGRSAVDHALREASYRLGKAEAYSQARSQADEAARSVSGGSEQEQPASASRDGEPGRLSAKGYPAEELQQVPIGGHALPPLPYAYDALEPYIDAKTMEIHHDKHHQAYVTDLNKAEKELQASRQNGNFDLVKHWERELAFNGAGHYLHTLFWTVMSPQGGGRPVGAIGDAIDHDFGGFDAFKKQFSEAAGKVEGGGWAILVWSPRSRRLEILQAEKHQNLSQWDAIPLLPLDVWEHAYYLKHQNKRPDYVKDWWNVVNWPYVNQRFEKAGTIAWEPY
ncbi:MULTISPECIES: Fe-Mn family superoxide dismutase [unclassified Paenibacillus]|uniref:Fe-Mn family superoxide dismutase n=1 Tax=unclassified Paenibacillus TaxID=185978 RepID=UPI000956BB61|nr:MULTISPECIES: Fe-Mn family superoxide dismutase [unclassified Paenibacillus]ASS67110.1 superoxide dismutase [Paenibacillus sp. RUD330]SIQ89936.1 superoxide dismutase, Fe-Mn family [Paenibacillus sp. RU4X]SIR10824.1 superoxide dismutase, Fe-Mn family [Paenibacillus sp. RU4T]